MARNIKLQYKVNTHTTYLFCLLPTLKEFSLNLIGYQIFIDVGKELIHMSIYLILMKYNQTIMYHEIHEIPDTIKTKVLEWTVYERIAEKIKNSRIVYIIGSGTSFHASIVGEIYFLENNIPTIAVRAPEFENFLIGNHDNVTAIFISQSGESYDTIEALKYAKHNKIFTIGITNNERSTLASDTDIPVITGAGMERALAATKSHIAQIISLYMISCSISSPRTPLNMNELSSEVKMFMKNEDKIMKLSEKIRGRIIILGNGLLHAVAMESALKFEETSNRITEAYPIGEYLHGPIQVLNNNDTVILMGSKNESYDRVKSKISKITNNIVTIGDSHDNDICLNLSLDKNIKIIFYLITIYLMANNLSIISGLNPDTPEKLTKVVKS